MRSSFWHIGINVSLERGLDKRFPGEGWKAPRVKGDWSIEWKPLLDHHDPDFERLTYGEPWGRINKLMTGDVAFFLESGVPDYETKINSWSYYVVAAFVTEEVYNCYRDHNTGMLLHTTLECPIEHLRRVAENAHTKRGDQHYAVLLGDPSKSKVLFRTPLKISNKQDPLPPVREALGLDPEQRYTGYWWKHWFGDQETRAMMSMVQSHDKKFSEALGVSK